MLSVKHCTNVYHSPFMSEALLGFITFEPFMQETPPRFVTPFMSEAPLGFITCEPFMRETPPGFIVYDSFYE